MLKSQKLIRINPQIISNCAVLFFLLIFTLCLLLIVDNDGWFRIESVRGDSSWFFMGGKSLVNGLVPYVDFSDSKGLLLWLIYGLGYLISPYNFYGVFIFEVLFYWITFYILFLSANLILHNKNKSILASCCMGIFYFYPGLHNQIIVEDFCHIFQAVTFYVTLRIILLQEYKNGMIFVLGLCFGALLMMKYVFAFPIGITVFCLFLFVLFKRLANWYIFILSFLFGFLIVVLPFLIYLNSVGAFNAFFKEYFLNTGMTILNLKSINPDEIGSDVFHRWPLNNLLLIKRDNYFGEYLRLILVGLLLTIFLFRSSWWMGMTLGSWYLGSILLYSYNISERYFLVLGIFAFGGVLSLISLLPILKKEITIVCVACFLGLVTLITTFYQYSEFNNPVRDRKALAEKEKVAFIINTREKEIGRRPTIVYYNTWDKGEHVKTNAVAGIKYWAAQGGMTEDMTAEHEKDIQQNNPDFVIIERKDKIRLDKIKQWGYVCVLEYNPWGEVVNNEDWIYQLLERNW